jgi:hypothetical protein
VGAGLSCVASHDSIALCFNLGWYGVDWFRPGVTLRHLGKGGTIAIASENAAAPLHHAAGQGGRDARRLGQRELKGSICNGRSPPVWPVTAPA